MTSATEKLKFKLCLILIHLYINSHMWILLTMLDSRAIRWGRESPPCLPSMTDEDGVNRVPPV